MEANKNRIKESEERDLMSKSLLGKGFSTFHPGDLLTPTQAAEELGVTVARVLVFCREGRLGERLGSRVYVIRRADLERFKALPRPPGRPRTALRLNSLGPKAPAGGVPARVVKLEPAPGGAIVEEVEELASAEVVASAAPLEEPAGLVGE